MKKYLTKVREARPSFIREDLEDLIDYLCALSKEGYTSARFCKLSNLEDVAMLNSYSAYSHLEGVEYISTIEKYKHILIEEGFDIQELDWTITGITTKKRPVFFNLFSKQVEVNCEVPVHYINISWDKR